MCWQTFEAYEGLDVKAAENLATIFQQDLVRWSKYFPIFRRITPYVTIDVAQSYPELYTEPYQILTMLHSANHDMKSVIAVNLPVWLPSQRQLRTINAIQHGWLFGNSGPAYLSVAFYHELGHILSIAEYQSRNPTYQPEVRDVPQLEASADLAMKRAFPPATYHATKNAIRHAWRAYRRWRAD